MKLVIVTICAIATSAVAEDILSKTNVWTEHQKLYTNLVDGGFGTERFARLRRNSDFEKSVSNSAASTFATTCCISIRIKGNSELIFTELQKRTHLRTSTCP